MRQIVAICLFILLSCQGCQDPNNGGNKELEQPSFSSLFIKQCRDSKFRKDKFYIKGDSLFRKGTEHYNRKIEVPKSINNHNKPDEYIEITNFLDQDSTYNFTSESTESSFALNLRRLNKTDLLFKLGRTDSTGFYVEISDTVCFYENNRYSEIEFRKSFENGQYILNTFKSNRDKETLNASFRYEPEGKLYPPSREFPFSYFSSYNIEPIPTFLGEISNQSYSRILSELILRGIGDQRKAKGWEKEFRELEIELEKKGVAKSLTVDSSTLKQLIHMEDFELIKRMNKYNYVYRGLPIKEIKPKIPIDEFDDLIVYSKYTFKGPRFIHFTTKGEKPAPKEYRTSIYFNNPMISKSIKNRFLLEDTLYNIMYSEGEAQWICNLTIWKKDSTHYTFLNVLNPYVDGLNIDTVFVRNNTNYIIGHRDTGEGGDYWGSVWLSEWVKPGTLVTHFKKSWECVGEYEHEEDNSLKQKMDHKIFSDRLEVNLTKKNKGTTQTIFYYSELDGL